MSIKQLVISYRFPRLNNIAVTAMLCCFTLGFFAAKPAVAQANNSDEWQFTVTPYLWAAGVGGQTSGGAEIEVPFSDVVDNLKWGFLGAVGARKGKWSVLGDVVVLDLESNKQTVLSGPLDPGIINVPVDAQFKLQSWVVHFAGGYNLLQSDTNSTLDVIFGTRLLDLDMDIKVDYEVLGEPRSRELSQSGNTWDAIVGLKGNIALGKRLYVPYQADIGTGESDFTWQALAGVSFRATSWLDLGVVYRHIEWDFGSDSDIADLSFSGPAASVKFRF